MSSWFASLCKLYISITGNPVQGESEEVAKSSREMFQQLRSLFLVTSCPCVFRVVRGGCRRTHMNEHWGSPGSPEHSFFKVSLRVFSMWAVLLVAHGLDPMLSYAGFALNQNVEMSSCPLDGVQPQYCCVCQPNL